MAAMTALSPAATKVFAALPGGTATSRQVAVSRQCSVPRGMMRMVVRCEAESSDKVKSSAPSPAVSVPPTPPPPAKAPSVMDVFSFGGSGPETINGRLAMVGFVACLGVEIASGAPLSRQLLDSGSESWFLFTVALFSGASLVPLFQGITPEKESGGIGGVFTSKAEMWNGRAAMLGLVALAITEYVKGSALV